MIKNFIEKSLSQVNKPSRYQSLDGWRGISILLVLAAHLLPLGPKQFQFNATAGTAGMAIFFTLSGFLITSILLNGEKISTFIIKRLARIVPLAWLVLLITFVFVQDIPENWYKNFIFIANWPPMSLFNEISHFWSLSVEVQFYFYAALIFLLVPKYVRPIIIITAICITSYRVYNQVPIAINTYYRVDEILAGSILSIIFLSKKSNIKSLIIKTPKTIAFLFFILTCSPFVEEVNYLRPYAAMILIGTTLFSHKENLINRFLNIQILNYIASISYALYVIHGGLRYTWLGSGETITKYLKRPILIAVTFILAHISTKHFESYFQRKAKQITSSKNSKKEL